MEDLSRLCVHTITTKPWSLEIAVEQYARAGIPGIAVWRDVLEGRSISAVRSLIANAGLQVVSLVRGGFFAAADAAARKRAVEDNLRMIAEAAELGAPLIVLVCGADPAQPLAESRKQILDAIREIAPVAADAGVKLAIEPLHPMYTDTKSAIPTIKSANDACVELGLDNVGVALDVYHIWWDPEVENEIRRCGEIGALFGFHVCDWRVPTRDFLLDRTIMGEGCIDVAGIRRMVDAAGYTGFIEVEIFSSELWATDQSKYLQRIVQAFLEKV